jgi:lactate dehydrogenase-like 2-hydroxyacid dehydrogenase
MKILLMTLEERVRRFFDLTTLPKDWELVFAGYEDNVNKLLAIAGDADVILADAMQPVPGELILGMPKLLMIHSEGVGYDRIDLETAKSQGVYVCNNAAANSRAVAEQAVMLMLAVLRHTVEGHSMVLQARQIEAKSQWCIAGIRELWNCHVGLIGMGSIGKETAKRLKGFECKISYTQRHRLPDELEKELGVGYLALDELLRNCDIVSLHLPSNAQTRDFMDMDSRMPSSSTRRAARL